MDENMRAAAVAVVNAGDLVRRQLGGSMADYVTAVTDALTVLYLKQQAKQRRKETNNGKHQDR